MFEEQARFGGPAPAAIHRRLEGAAGAYADTPRAEALLLDAQALDPRCLPVYFALYKFYFIKYRLAEANNAAVTCRRPPWMAEGTTPGTEEVRRHGWRR